MRKIKNASILLISAVSIILGLMMPDLVSRMQDENNANKVDRYETTQMQLKIAPSYELIDVLGIIAEGFSLVDLEKGSRLRVEDVKKVTEDSFAYFEAEGFPEFSPENWDELEAVPFLAVSETGDEAIILWQCSATSKVDGLSEAHFLIDDAHSKIVEMSIVSFVADYEALSGRAQGEMLSSWAQAWAGYLGFEYKYEAVSKDDLIAKSKKAEESAADERTNGESSEESSSKETPSIKDTVSSSSASGGGISGSSLSNGGSPIDTAASIAKAQGFLWEDLSLQSEKFGIVLLKHTEIELYLARTIQAYTKEEPGETKEGSAVGASAKENTSGADAAKVGDAAKGENAEEGVDAEEGADATSEKDSAEHAVWLVYSMMPAMK